MKNFVKALKMLIIIGFLFFSDSVFSAQIKPDILTKKFSEIGYKVKSKKLQIPTDWEKQEFQMLSKTVYIVKRTTPLKGNQANLYPRYEISEEIYENEEKAELREKRISEKPPNLPIEQREYWMVSGFRHKNTVYFISTDAVIFYENIGEFIENFHNSIKK